MEERGTGEEEGQTNKVNSCVSSPGQSYVCQLQLGGQKNRVGYFLSIYAVKMRSLFSFSGNSI